MTIKNSKGTMFYGMHFYPGVAEYQEDGKDPYRVFLNEDTIRDMDKSFAGRPVFVHHVESDDINTKVDDLRKDADGWVIRSFYNAADGKHWAEFIIVSERGLRAIRNGMRLSNAYLPSKFAKGGLWNGVTYEREITGGEYEHLAIVPNPRYEESVVLTPEKFKAYNEAKTMELQRIANAKEERAPGMLSIFKRAKVENAVDIEGMSVVLPKSGKEFTIAALVTAMDVVEEAKKGKQIANGLHLVAADSKMTVAELVAENEELKVKLENAKKKKNDEMESDEDGTAEKEAKKNGPEDDVVQPVPVAVNAEEDEEEESDEDKKKKKKNKAKCNEEEDEAAEMKAKKKKEDAKKANALKNAGPQNDGTQQVARVEFSGDQVSRGKARYGS